MSGTAVKVGSRVFYNAFFDRIVMRILDLLHRKVRIQTLLRLIVLSPDLIGRVAFVVGCVVFEEMQKPMPSALFRIVRDPLHELLTCVALKSSDNAGQRMLGIGCRRNDMDMAAHYDIGVDDQTLMFSSILQRFDCDSFASRSRK